jgi:hypothetical protein
MMVEARSRAAKRNLREGIRKMEEETMTPAARVRRDFRLGRPPRKVEDVLPLHPSVVWKKATDALSDFRARMIAANPPLNPGHAVALIVFIEIASPDKPQFIAIEEEVGKNCEKCQTKVFEQLSRGDVIALGMVFRQFDEKTSQFVRFPYQFTGLNERGIAVLQNAVRVWDSAGKLTMNVN